MEAGLLEFPGTLFESFPANTGQKVDLRFGDVVLLDGMLEEVDGEQTLYGGVYDLLCCNRELLGGLSGNGRGDHLHGAVAVRALDGWVHGGG
jgi:hypothetical protein